MLSDDYTFEEFYQELEQFDELITSFYIEKKTIVLPDRNKADVSDLVDLVNKFLEIKTILTNIDFEKLTLEDITLLIDEINELKNIISILKDDPSYTMSSDIIAKLYQLLQATIVRMQYVEDIKPNYSLMSTR